MHDAVPTPGRPLLRRAVPQEAERFARESEWTVEYAHGCLFAMAGGTPAHGAVLAALFAAISAHVGRGGCRTLEGHTRLYYTEWDYYLPDVWVTCAPPPPAGVMGYHDALLICEILSEETADRDTGQKLEDYRTLPSLREYVLVESRRRIVHRYARDEHDDWRHEILLPGATLHLESIGLDVDLHALYAGTGVEEDVPADHEIHDG